MRQTPSTDHEVCGKRFELVKAISEATEHLLSKQMSDPKYIFITRSINAATTAYQKHVEQHRGKPMFEQ